MAAGGGVPDSGPTWFRLTDEAWAMIGREYMAGATAKAIAAKWKVAPSSVYRHAGLNGWTKKRRGEAVSLSVLDAGRRALEAERAEWARQQAELEARPQLSGEPVEMAESAMRGAARALADGKAGEAERLVRLAERLRVLAAEAAARTRATSVEARAAGAPRGDGSTAAALDAYGCDQLLEPGDLARAALAGVSAAMRVSRLDVARELAQLADVLTRMSVRGPPPGDLDIIADALLDRAYANELMAVGDDPHPHPAKLRYWAEMARRARERQEPEAIAAAGDRDHFGG